MRITFCLRAASLSFERKFSYTYYISKKWKYPCLVYFVSLLDWTGFK